MNVCVCVCLRELHGTQLLSGLVRDTDGNGDEPALGTGPGHVHGDSGGAAGGAAAPGQSLRPPGDGQQGSESLA